MRLRTGREFRDHQVQSLVFTGKKMAVQKGGVKELLAATEELSSSYPTSTHFPLLHSPKEVMFINLLEQNGLSQQDTWLTNTKAVESKIYKIGNEIKMTVLVLTKTQKYNQLENRGVYQTEELFTWFTGSWANIYTLKNSNIWHFKKMFPKISHCVFNYCGIIWTL